MAKHLISVLCILGLCLSLAFPVRAASFGTEPPEPVPVTEETEAVPAETEPETMFSAPYPLYFGLLHAHTDLSDGLGPVEEAFSHAAAEGLDFFAVTDHSNSLTEEEWSRLRTAAAEATTEAFLALPGYEMTWPETMQLGHIAAFGTPGFLSREQPEFSGPSTALEAYYQALTQIPGAVGMLCHPGDYYGTFHSFGHYRWEYDRQLALLEVVSGKDGRFYDAYTRALDAGWHLAPAATQNTHDGIWEDGSGVRTVVLAESLTQQDLLEALRQHRAYATEDPDLHIYFDLDGELMGGTLSRADRPEVTVQAWDPSGEAIGTLEVVSQGGQILAREELTEHDVFLTLPVPAGLRYYFLRITQPDGDVAVTAPVWVEGFENMGILDFTPDTAAPVQGDPVNLILTLFNDEGTDFLLEEVVLSADGEAVFTLTSPGTVAPGSTLALSIPYTHPISGETVLRAQVRGRVRGEGRSYDQSLTLRFRSGAEVTGILVDGSHENAGLDTMERLCALAEEAGLDLTLVTEDLPRGGQLLVIPDPREPLEDAFLADARAFAENGGTLILWGERAYLQPLLDTLGSTLTFSDAALPAGSATSFNTASPWCAALTAEQFFSHPARGAVDPGAGEWLVRRGADGPVLLAREDTAWGGSVFLSAAPFLLDAHIPAQESSWDLPRAAETLLRTLLEEPQSLLLNTAVSTVRRGTPGTTFRIRGYVTAGTSRPGNRFPDTVYLQDDTGGIAVTGFTAGQIQVGAPMEVIGVLSESGGNLVLEYRDHRLLSEAWYRHDPRTTGCATASDYASSGGNLVRVEGRVTELSLTGDRKGICRLVITDIRGDTAVIEIEPEILSGSTGENRLAEEIRKDRTVRALGLVHINKAGETVIRVRNCDEVVWVPPTTDTTNPPTGDRAWFRP